MPRVKRGVVAKARHKKILKKANISFDGGLFEGPFEEIPLDRQR